MRVNRNHTSLEECGFCVLERECASARNVNPGETKKELGENKSVLEKLA